MNTQHDDSMLDMVAAYAVGAIDATTGECAAVRAHIAECPLCQEEFKVMRAATAAIGLSASETPPPHLRERVLASLPPRVVPLARPRRTGWFVPAVAAAAVVIAGGFWWNVHRNLGPRWVALCVPGAVNCHARGDLTVSAAGQLRLELNGLASLPAGKEYQAWFITPGAPPKPEPTFSANERGDGSVEIPQSAITGAVVAVTVEPAGGSKAPTTKPFLIAKIE
jgi:anti-sigma-K factor RskA